MVNIHNVYIDWWMDGLIHSFIHFRLDRMAMVKFIFILFQNSKKLLMTSWSRYDLFLFFSTTSLVENDFLQKFTNNGDKSLEQLTEIDFSHFRGLSQAKMEFQQEQYHPMTQDAQHQQCRSKWWALKNLSPKGQKDGPYAYFVCLCGFICILLPTGCAFSYGILFPVLLAEFNEGKAKTGTLFIRYIKPRNLSTRRTVGMYCVLCIIIT